MLHPLEKISQKTLFPITCVGTMAIALVPMRVGEIVRPYLIKTKSQIPFTSSLATIFVERVLDVLALIFILSFAIFNSDLPEWLIISGYISFIIFILLICLIFFIYYKTEFIIKLSRPFLNNLPQNFIIKIEELIRTFADGFKVISSSKRLLYTVFLSVLIWIFSTLAIYNLYFTQNLQLPFFTSFVVLFITMIGISLPTAPGFIGNWQYGCILALSIFDISKGDALAFSIVYHLSAMSITIILGMIFLPFVNISIKDIRKKLAVIRIQN